MCKEHEKRGLCLPVTLLGCDNNGLTTRKRIVAQQRVTTAAQDRFVPRRETVQLSVASLRPVCSLHHQHGTFTWYITCKTEIANAQEHLPQDCCLQ